MPAPTFVAKYESDWASALGLSQEMASVTVSANDLLLVFCVGATWANSDDNIVTPFGGGLTYSLLQQVRTLNEVTLGVWAAPCDSPQSFTLTSGRDPAHNSGNMHGACVMQFAAVAGVGASQVTAGNTGAPLNALTTVGENSAVVLYVGDWNAVSGSSRTWRTVNGTTPTAGNGYELSYATVSGQYTLYGAQWPDAGPAGANSFGLSAPAGQKYQSVAVELRASVASSAHLPTGTQQPTTQQHAASW
jgi:hypothetical protein